MNPDGPAMLTVALAIAAMGSVLLWRVQNFCPDCDHCRRARLAAVEAKRAKDAAEDEQRHVWFHKMYPVKWKSTDCNWCRRGLDDQEPRP